LKRLLLKKEAGEDLGGLLSGGEKLARKSRRTAIDHLC